MYFIAIRKHFEQHVLSLFTVSQVMLCAFLVIFNLIKQYQYVGFKTCLNIIKIFLNIIKIFSKHAKHFVLDAIDFFKILKRNSLLFRVKCFKSYTSN